MDSSATTPERRASVELLGRHIDVHLSDAEFPGDQSQDGQRVGSILTAFTDVFTDVLVTSSDGTRPMGGEIRGGDIEPFLVTGCRSGWTDWLLSHGYLEKTVHPTITDALSALRNCVEEEALSGALPVVHGIALEWDGAALLVIGANPSIASAVARRALASGFGFIASRCVVLTDSGKEVVSVPLPIIDDRHTTGWEHARPASDLTLQWSPTDELVDPARIVRASRAGTTVTNGEQLPVVGIVVARLLGHGTDEMSVIKPSVAHDALCGVSPSMDSRPVDTFQALANLARSVPAFEVAPSGVDEMIEMLTDVAVHLGAPS